MRQNILNFYSTEINSNYYVENFGASGLDLHYEVSNFINLLRFTKNPPEIVIFIDGYNDIFNKLKGGGEFFIHNFFNTLMFDQNNFHKSIYFFSEFKNLPALRSSGAPVWGQEFK